MRVSATIVVLAAGASLAAPVVRGEGLPGCVERAGVHRALLTRVGAEANGTVTLEPSGDGLEVRLERNGARVASRRLPRSEDCAALEQAIVLLVTSWWSLPVKAPSPAPPEPQPVVVRPPAPKPAPTPEPPPPPPPPVPAPPAEPTPAVVVAAEPAPPEPPPVVVTEAPPAEPPSPWRWSVSLRGLAVLNGPVLPAGQLALDWGRRDGFAGVLDLGVEGIRRAKQGEGSIAAVPWFASLGASLERPLGPVVLEASAGARLYLVWAEARGFATNRTATILSPAAYAQVEARLPVWRGVYVSMAVVGGARFRPESLTIDAVGEVLALPPWFGGVTLGIGFGGH